MAKQTLLFVFFLFPFISISQTLKENLVKAYSSQDSSDFYFKAAKKLIKTKADEGEYFFCKGARHTDFGNADSAIFFNKLAIEKINKTDDTNSLLTIYNNLSKVYNKRGEYDKAIEATLIGLKIAEASKSDSWTAFFQSSQSINYHDFESFAKGIYYGKMALKNYLRLKEPNPMSVYTCLNAIAINFDDWNQPDSALVYHKKVFDYVKGDDTLRISTYNNIGNTLHKMKRNKEAQQWLERALRISEANKNAYFGIGYNYEQAAQYTNLATIAFELNDFKKAERLFDSAYVHATKSKNAQKMRDYYYAQFQFNKKRKNLEKTIQYQEEYIVLRDSVFNEKRNQSIIEVEAKYQNEKKEKELLEAQNKLINEEVEGKRKTTIIYLISVSAIFLSLISYLIYKYQKQKNKQQEQEFELKAAIKEIDSQNKLHEQKLAISRDLHDNIGAQLTFVISSIENLKYENKISKKEISHSITQQLNKISDFAKGTIVELRDTIWAMNVSEFTIEDFQSRIIGFIDKAQSVDSAIEFKFENDSELKGVKFSSLLGINLYRTIQEAIHNAIKYADAKTISVYMTKENGTIKTVIQDDGKGFELSKIDLGNGMENMKKRIEDTNGHFEITSQPSVGTKVTISLPLKESI